jgi:uncharacterized protein YbjT (DUF2867 family)
MSEQSERTRKILVTGATGYVGGRLVKLLELRGEQLRCLARRPEVLRKRVADSTEVVYGDVSLPETLDAAFTGVDCAYYLIHSLGSSGDFEVEEERSARHFVDAAFRAGVKRIIYLGGLCDESAPPSSHMRSRLRVGQVLRSCGVETVEFRASIIIGSGSLSFELIRALVQRLPVMLTPRWVSILAQPIAIGDVIAYLMAALDLEPGESRVYEIGGAERMSYVDLMREYASLAGLRRVIIRVPVLTPWLSSLWLSLVTPIFAQIGRKLIESITTPSVVQNDRALRDFPVRPVGVRAAIDQALHNEDRQFAETHWTDALSSVEKPAWGGVSFGNRIVDSRVLRADLTPEAAFWPIQRIGGATGWYYGNALWQLRGLLDRMAGGVGMHRGRRDPESLRVGDVVDCWRVELFDPPRRLVLAAEMKLPGRAWLQFDVEPQENGVLVRQTAQYDPVGLLGLAYWYALYPVHQFVFAGMLRGIVLAALRQGAKS